MTANNDNKPGNSPRKAQKIRAAGGFARTVRLLEDISAAGPFRFAELEERLQMPKASLHRALNDLLSERLIQFDDRSLTYSAGYRILEIANQVWSRSDLRALAHDQLEQLCALSNETVQLAVLADTHVVYIDSVEGDNNIRMSTSVGNKVPVYCSSPGKILLSWCSAAEQKNIIDRVSFAEFTASTITKPEKLQLELRQSRQQGYAEDNGEHFLGVRSIASAILDRKQKAVAAISITAPTFRITDERFDQWRAALPQACKRVSSRLPPNTQ